MGSHQREGEREHAIDFLRWVAIFGVIIQHSHFRGRYNPSTLAHLATLRVLFGWCVLFFFMAAGYLVRVEVPLPLQLRRRALRLLLPFVVVSLISLILFTIAVKLRLTSAGDAFGWKTVLVRFLTLRGFGPQMYFLPYLFVISMVTLALVKRLGLRGAFLVFGGMAALQWSLDRSPRGSVGPHLDRVMLYAFAYLGGIAMQRSAEISPRRLMTGAVLVTAGLLGLVGCGLGAGSLVQLVVPFWLWWLFRRLPLSARARGWARASGTGAVYLWHVPVLLPGLTVVMDRLGLTDLPNFMAAALLTVLICLGIDRFARAVRLERVLTL